MLESLLQLAPLPSNNQEPTTLNAKHAICKLLTGDVDEKYCPAEVKHVKGSFVKISQNRPRQVLSLNPSSLLQLSTFFSQYISLQMARLSHCCFPNSSLYPFERTS